MTLKHRVSALALAVLLAGPAAFASALVVESPECDLFPHVSGEFTNQTQLEADDLRFLELVPVTPFTACEPIEMDLRGKVAFIQRGDCNFAQKVWNAQRAHAIGVVVMDSDLRDEPPYHVIMQKDEIAALIRIPSLFVSYATGEWLLGQLQSEVPWDPVRVSLTTNGEVVHTSTSNRLLKRALAYVFLISIVCVFSSGLSILSSAAFQWIGKTRRSRASKYLPIAKYEKNLQRSLLQHLLEADFVIDRIPMTEIDKLHRPSYVGEETPSDCSTQSRDTRADSSDSTSAEPETCSICLDDFESGDDIKVLPCQHFFHVDCINPWLEKRSGRCPLCKRDAIATVNGPSKKLFGIPLPRIDQILQQEQWVHAFLLMLPASFISCLLVNTAASMISTMWP